MIAYCYHPDTGEFVEQTPMRESPLEPGTHLLPAHATTIAPPAFMSGRARCWDGAAWTQAEDNRGMEIFGPAGEVKAIEELGPVPAGWSSIAGHMGTEGPIRPRGIGNGTGPSPQPRPPPRL